MFACGYPVDWGGMSLGKRGSSVTCSSASAGLGPSIVHFCLPLLSIVRLPRTTKESHDLSMYASQLVFNASKSRRAEKVSTPCSTRKLLQEVCNSRCIFSILICACTSALVPDLCRVMHGSVGVLPRVISPDDRREIRQIGHPAAKHLCACIFEFNVVAWLAGPQCVPESTGSIDIVHRQSVNFPMV